MIKNYYAEVKSSGVVPSGIKYQRIRPSWYPSIRTGDVGWHNQNGFYDYTSDPANPLYTQDLDFATYGYGTTSGHYFLKHNNAFGNKLRFTNSIGGGATDNCGRFTAASFTGALDGYVIDHLTGIGYDVRATSYVGTWDACIDAIAASTIHSFTDWMPLSNIHLINVLNMRYDATSNTVGQSNIFSYTAWTLAWASGEYVKNLTTNSWRFRVTSAAFESVARTTSLAMFACRNHY